MIKTIYENKDKYHHSYKVSFSKKGQKIDYVMFWKTLYKEKKGY